mmetsp:Transcript_78316/g.221445  ORF Transcript_78316/g.221445 Transcript_78316/m.221445 type:complete len:724 (+) Transcript_78316:36-2207(+)
MLTFQRGLGPDTAAPTNASVTLQKLVYEYGIELRETRQLREDCARLKTHNSLLVSMIDDRQKLCFDREVKKAMTGGDVEHENNDLLRSGASAQDGALVESGEAERETDDLPRSGPGARGREGAAAQGGEAEHGSVDLLDSTSYSNLSMSLPGQVSSKTGTDWGQSSKVSHVASCRSFDLREEWRRSEEDAVAPRPDDHMPTFATTPTDEAFPKTKSNIDETSMWQCMISHPQSQVRMVWGVVGAALVTYDIILTPLQVFEPGESLFFAFMDWATLLFWTVDMLCGPFMGYMRKGVVEMRPDRVFTHYFHSGRWLMDLVVVVPDWVFTLLSLGSSTDPGNSVRLLRILRVARSMRLIRLSRVKWLLAAIDDMIASEYVNILVGIAKMLVFLMVINHILACAWYATASLFSPPGADTWLRHHGFEQDHGAYVYATSFHWAITQFTPASMHVQPQNLVERSFAIAVVVFALIGFSYIVGSISASLAKLRGMKEENAHQFWQLKRYLKQHNVPQHLRVRIIRNGEHAVQLQKERVHLENNKIYTLISDQLRNELASAVVAPFLVVHPLFHHLCTLPGATMRRLAMYSVSYQLVGRSETVFHPGEIATHMLFVIEGKLRYKRKVPGCDPEQVDSREDWIAEPVLWTPVWKHLGALLAMEECNLLRVDPTSFSKTIRLNPAVFSQVKYYALRFIAWISDRTLERLSDIGQGEDISGELRSFIPLDECRW